MGKNYAHKSGNIVGQDGRTHNIVDLLGGGTPVSDEVHDIRRYAPLGGCVIGSDGKVYDLVELLQNISGGGGGGGGGPVKWGDILYKPTAYPPEPHDHNDRYYTREDIDNAGYLVANTDNQTIRVQGGELQAMSLSGLQLAVSQLNAWLAGTEGNIQSQINDILLTLAALSAGMRYRGKFETKSSLDGVTIKDNGDLAVVLADETHGGARSLYVYNDSLGIWDFVGAFEFADAFTSLTDTPNAYDNGKLLRSGINGLYFDTVKWSEIDGRPERSKAAIEGAVDKAHTHAKSDAEISFAVELAHPHPNIAALNRIGIDSQGRITVDGVPYVPASQNKQRLFAYRSGSDQPLTAGTDCVFNTKHSGDIPYDTATGVFTLEAGKLYRVEVAGSLYTSGWVILQLVNAETNSIVNTIARGIWMDVNPSTTSWHESSSGPLKTYIVPAATRGYKIRATSVSGESSLRSSYMSLEIVEI